MNVHLQRHIDKLNRLIVHLGTLVEEALARATQAVERRDGRLAQAVVEGDRAIDLEEIAVEEECLAILALHQPVAHDLRYVVAVLKLNRDLERIGDRAANVAKQALALAEEPAIELASSGLFDMARMAQGMLKQSLDALVTLDADLAQKVRRADAQVDALHRGMYQQVEERIRENPERAGALIRLLITIRHYERIADHAVNIARDVIYLVEGRIVRHERLRRGEAAAAGNTP